jgi:hypothetical protein
MLVLGPTNVILVQIYRVIDDLRFKSGPCNVCLTKFGVVVTILDREVEDGLVVADEGHLGSRKIGKEEELLG